MHILSCILSVFSSRHDKTITILIVKSYILFIDWVLQLMSWTSYKKSSSTEHKCVSKSIKYIDKNHFVKLLSSLQLETNMNLLINVHHKMIINFFKKNEKNVMKKSYIFQFQMIITSWKFHKISLSTLFIWHRIYLHRIYWNKKSSATHSSN